MAPRGRPRKRGKTRLDAALKAMAALTFPEKLVRDTVDELLEVYGGDDGWGFIEDASYSVLIDTLLDKQQDGTEKGIASPQGHARSDNGTEISAVAPSLSGVSSRTPMEAMQSQTNQPVNSAPLTKMPDSKDCLPSNRRRPYHGWIGNDDDEDLVLVKLTPAPLTQELKKLLNWVIGREYARQDSKDCLPSNRRRPYHGWIGNDDDEDLVLVELTPAPLPLELKKLLNWVIGREAVRQGEM